MLRASLGGEALACSQDTGRACQGRFAELRRRLHCMACSVLDLVQTCKAGFSSLSELRGCRCAGRLVGPCDSSHKGERMGPPCMACGNYGNELCNTGRFGCVKELHLGSGTKFEAVAGSVFAGALLLQPAQAVFVVVSKQAPCKRLVQLARLGWSAMHCEAGRAKSN